MDSHGGFHRTALLVGLEKLRLGHGGLEFGFLRQRSAYAMMDLNLYFLDVE